MKSIEAAGGAAANLFKRITKDRPTSVLIPGGKSPIPFYHKLAKSDLNWGGITLLATDERVVSFSDENRNTKMIQLELLSNIKSGKPPALIENYPQSIYTLQKDKDYQYETDINNGTLLLFNDKTEILLSVGNPTDE